MMFLDPQRKPLLLLILPYFYCCGYDTYCFILLGFSIPYRVAYHTMTNKTISISERRGKGTAETQIAGTEQQGAYTTFSRNTKAIQVYTCSCVPLAYGLRGETLRHHSIA